MPEDTKTIWFWRELFLRILDLRFVFAIVYTEKQAGPFVTLDQFVGRAEGGGAEGSGGEGISGWR